MAGAVGLVDLGEHPVAGAAVVGQDDVGQELGLQGGDAGGNRLQLGFHHQQQSPPLLTAGLVVGLPLCLCIARAGRGEGCGW